MHAAAAYHHPAAHPAPRGGLTRPAPPLAARPRGRDSPQRGKPQSGPPDASPAAPPPPGARARLTRAFGLGCQVASHLALWRNLAMLVVGTGAPAPTPARARGRSLVSAPLVARARPGTALLGPRPARPLVAPSRLTWLGGCGRSRYPATRSSRTSCGRSAARATSTGYACAAPPVTGSPNAAQQAQCRPLRLPATGAAAACERAAADALRPARRADARRARHRRGRPAARAVEPHPPPRHAVCLGIVRRVRRRSLCMCVGGCYYVGGCF